MSENALACMNNWLDVTPAQGNTITTNTNYNNTSSGYIQPWGGTYYHYYPYYYPVYISPSRPVKLKLSEIEKLRLLAKEDSGLKSILQKFTPLIEIEVDF